jgi:hypothetical protein
MQLLPIAHLPARSWDAVRREQATALGSLYRQNIDAAEAAGFVEGSQYVVSLVCEAVICCRSEFQRIAELLQPTIRDEADRRITELESGVVEARSR